MTIGDLIFGCVWKWGNPAIQQISYLNGEYDNPWILGQPVFRQSHAICYSQLELLGYFPKSGEPQTIGFPMKEGQQLKWSWSPPFEESRIWCDVYEKDCECRQLTWEFMTRHVSELAKFNQTHYRRVLFCVNNGTPKSSKSFCCCVWHSCSELVSIWGWLHWLLFHLGMGQNPGT